MGGNLVEEKVVGRFGMSIGKIMMLEEVDGVLKHKRKKNCERSCMQTRSMRLALWLVGEVIGRIETEILILRKKLTSSGNAKRTRTTQMKSDGHADSELTRSKNVIGDVSISVIW